MTAFHLYRITERPPKDLTRGLIDGDIELSPNQEIEMDEETGLKTRASKKGIKLWPQGIVPYDFSQNLSRS